MKEIKKVLMHASGRMYYIKDISNDYHTEFGFIKKSDLRKDGKKVISNTKEAFWVFKPGFIDVYKKIKRGPQIIARKDIGLIIVETGINKKSKIVDAGAGSGALACMLAQYAKEITTYEIRDDFAKLVKENINFLKLKNVKVKNKSIYEGITEKNVDLISLDLPEPWFVIKHAKKALKIGGYVVSYSPTIVQTSDFINAVSKEKSFIHEKTIEILEREWEVDKRKIRPKSKMIGHTGFLSFIRKIGGE